MYKLLATIFIAMLAQRVVADIPEGGLCKLFIVLMRNYRVRLLTKNI